MAKREEPFLLCPACGHVLVPLGAGVAAAGADGTDAVRGSRCPECGLAEAAALAVPRRAARIVLVALVVAAAARLGHAVGLVGPELGWTSRGAEQSLLAIRVGAWIAMAVAFALLAVRPRVSAAGRWAAWCAALAVVATAIVVLTLGIGGLGVMSLPTWLLDLLVDPAFARTVGAVPPAAQGIAAVGFSVALWPTMRGGRRALLAMAMFCAMLFVCMETLVRTQLLETVIGRQWAAIAFGWRLWSRVLVDAVAAVAWLAAARWRW